MYNSSENFQWETCSLQLETIFYKGVERTDVQQEYPEAQN